MSNKSDTIDVIGESRFEDGMRLIQLQPPLDNNDDLKKFRHDLMAAVRTFKFLANKAIDDDPSQSQRKKQVIAKHLNNLNQIIDMFNSSL